MSTRSDLKLHFAREIDDSTLQKYLSFLEETPSGNFTQSPYWAELVEKSKLQSYAFVWGVDGDGIWQLAGLLRLTKVGPGRFLGAFRRGPVTRTPGALAQWLPLIHSRLAEEGVCTLTISPHWEREDSAVATRVLEESGYHAYSPAQQTLPVLTPLIDLRPEEDDILASFKYRARRNIKKAVKAGLTVRPADTAEDIERFMVVLHAMAEQNQMELGGLPRFDDLLDHYKKTKDGIFILCELPDGSLVSGTTIYREGKRAYLNTLATSPSHLNVPKSTLLIWEGMRMMKALGCDWMDLVGYPPADADGVVDPGLASRARYKDEFSPEIVPLPTMAYRVLKPVSHMVLFKGRELYRQPYIKKLIKPLLYR